jgi:hypothetical protein
VTLGQRQGEDVVVTKGLADGERVVVTGQLTIQPGAKVRVEEAVPTPLEPPPSAPGKKPAGTAGQDKS